MQAAQLSPLQGWGWIRAGWQVFRLQPINLCALAATYLLLAAFTEWSLVLLVEAGCDSTSAFGCRALQSVAQFAILVPLPLLTVGLWQGAREALAGRVVFPVLLFWAFGQGRQTVLRLLAVGAIEGALLVGVQWLVPAPPALPDAPPAAADATAKSPSAARPPPGTLTTAPSGPLSSFAPSGASAPKAPAATDSVPEAKTPEASGPDGAAAIDPDALATAARAMMFNYLACVPIFLLLWFTPALTAWDRLPVGKSLFFSCAAAWRNRWPFLTFGLSLFALFVGLVFVLSLLAELGIGSFVIVFLVPAVVTLVAVYQCACYASYRTVLTPSAPPGRAEP